MTPLYGHTSEETSYLVGDYPYGRSVRCRIRYWIESDPNKGFRFCSQTENPRTLTWNKPKKSTYSLLAGCMFLDEKGHVQWSGLGGFTSETQVLNFITQFPEADLSKLRPWCGGKIKFYQGRIDGSVKWTINGKVKEDSPEEMNKLRAELTTWEECSRLLKENQAKRIMKSVFGA